MFNNLIINKMKKNLTFFAAAIVAMSVAASCSEPLPEVEPTGNINLSGKYVTYMHGNQGWIEEDEIGVFVDSGEKLQSNLKFIPSKVCPLVENEYVPGIFTYDNKNYADGQVILLGQESASFYSGKHGVYAYVPYNEGEIEYTAVPLPSQTVQEYADDNTFCPKKKYCFAYANTSISSYSVKLSELEFVTPFIQMTVPTPIMSDDMIGKKVTKVVISAPVNIAVDEATIDLSTGKVSGTLSKSVELVLPAGGLEISGGWFGANLETLYFSLFIAYETAMDTEFTFTFTIDGKEYTAKNTPATGFFSTAENLGMYQRLTIE